MACETVRGRWRVERFLLTARAATSGTLRSERQRSGSWCDQDVQRLSKTLTPALSGRRNSSGGEGPDSSTSQSADRRGQTTVHCAREGMLSRSRAVELAKWARARTWAPLPPP